MKMHSRLIMIGFLVVGTFTFPEQNRHLKQEATLHLVALMSREWAIRHYDPDQMFFAIDGE